MKKYNLSKSVAFTGIFAAFIFLMTYIHMPIGFNGGYIHFGDALVYLAATVLPLPYAMLASAIGAGLSDVLSPGGVVWLIPTLIIKSISCPAFSRTSEKLLCPRNIIAVFVGGMINIVGYFFATAAIAGFPVAVAELAISFIQPVGSGIFFVILALALDKAHIKSYIPSLERRS